MSEFKPIPGFESYEVNKEGVVRSISRSVKTGTPSGSRVIPSQIKKVTIDKHGHPTVQLFKDNKKTTLRVDLLVKELFK